MSVMYIRDKTGKLVPVHTIRGAKGQDGTVAFENLTEEQKESLKGKPGKPGDPGDPFTYEDFTEEQLAALRGAAGKSAYEYARDGGYTGTEAEFAVKMAKESAPAYTYGTEDIEAGSASTAATGTLHFVYE